MSAGITANNDGSADITVGGVSAIEISAAGAVTIPNLASSGIPSGAVFWFAANAAPIGYLEASGAAVSRTTYAALFAVVGTTFGSGDGSTTFNLPNLRGEFIRGWDNGRGVDPARAFGSSQADAFASHTHGGVPVSAASAGMVFNPTASYNATAGSTSAAGGTETRPRNVALLPCIKT
jgi:phage-related tail fiber protein